MLEFTATAKHALIENAISKTPMGLYKIYNPGFKASYDIEEDEANYLMQLMALADAIKLTNPYLDWVEFDTMINSVTTNKELFKSDDRFFSALKLNLETLALALMDPAIPVARKLPIQKDLAAYVAGCARGIVNKLQDYVDELNEPQTPLEFLHAFSKQVTREVTARIQGEAKSDLLKEPTYTPHFEYVIQNQAYRLGLGPKPQAIEDPHLSALNLNEITLGRIRLILIEEVTANHFASYCKQLLTDILGTFGKPCEFNADNIKKVEAINSLFRRILPDYATKPLSTEPPQFMYYPEDITSTRDENRFHYPKPILVTAIDEKAVAEINLAIWDRLDDMIRKQLDRSKLISYRCTNEEQLMLISLTRSPEKLVHDERLYSKLFHHHIKSNILSKKQLILLSENPAGLAVILGNLSIFDHCIKQGILNDTECLEHEIELNSRKVAVQDYLPYQLNKVHIQRLLSHENGIKLVAINNKINSFIPTDLILKSLENELVISSKISSSGHLNTLPYLFIMADNMNAHKAMYCTKLLDCLMADDQLLEECRESNILKKAFNYAINSDTKDNYIALSNLIQTKRKQARKDLINYLRDKPEATIANIVIELSTTKKGRVFFKEYIKSRIKASAVNYISRHRAINHLPKSSQCEMGFNTSSVAKSVTPVLSTKINLKRQAQVKREEGDRGAPRRRFC